MRALAGCGKRVFGPLSTDEITHYDVFYQAINTEYWGPTLVFPHPARGSTAKREPMEAKESPFRTTYWDSLALNARAGSNSVALTGLAQSNAGNKTQRYLPHLIRCRLSRFDCPRLSLATWTRQEAASHCAEDHSSLSSLVAWRSHVVVVCFWVSSSVVVVLVVGGRGRHRHDCGRRYHRRSCGLLRHSPAGSSQPLGPITI